MDLSTAARPQLRPAGLTTQSNLVRTASAVLAASVLVAVCAHVTIVLPFTPVPITLSNFAVILVGMLLGPGAGCLALLLYLAEGALGAPVFNPHGVGGVAQLFGPTGGFLLSYPVSALAAGWLVRRLRPYLPVAPSALIAGFVAGAPTFLLGAGWLAILLHLSAERAVALAVTPFLPGECVKVLVAAGLLASLNRLHRPPLAR